LIYEEEEMHKLKILWLLLALFSMVLFACQPAATQAPTEAVIEEPTEVMAEPTEVMIEEPVATEVMEEPTAVVTEMVTEVAEEPTEEPAAITYEEPEIDVLRLGFGLDPVFAPHIVAIEKGWFEEAGFQSVETESFTAGALAGEALAAGEIQLWTPGNVPPISMRHNGMPIVVVGTNTLAYLEHFIARADAQIEQPEDLYNIRIGLLEGSTASAVLNNIAEEYGLDVTQMQVVNLPPPEQFTALTNNEIQAMIVWPPWIYIAQNDPNVEVEILHDGMVSHFPWDEGTESQVSFTRSLWVMAEDFIRENPNAARNIMLVLLRAQDYVSDPANREEVLTMVAEFLEQPREQVEAPWDRYPFESTFDQDYVRDQQEYTNFLFDAGVIGEQIDPLEYTYTGYAEEYDPSLVTVPGNWQP
jgi:ABC-type nitrate/sulfonate/bicarbonate transport system substrate-binding protein